MPPPPSRRAGVLLACAGAVLAAPPRTQDAAIPPIVLRTTPPAGLPDHIPAPADNPLSEAAFALGRTLFFDPVLSLDRTVSCASCHDPDHGFASREARPPGVRGRRARRDAPSLFNRAWGRHQLWDGRAGSLEQQALLPIEDPDEMALPLSDAIARLREARAYRDRFRTVFDAEPDAELLARALASFVRGLTLGDSPVDRFFTGDIGALDARERAGMWIYESKGGCWRCHPRPLFSDEKFHNTGVGVRDGMPEDGRMAVTGEASDRGRFKTPTLRGVADTAPYMHDGSLETLRDVVEFYRRGGNANPDLSPLLQPLELSDADADNLVAFLRALSR